MSLRILDIAVVTGSNEFDNYHYIKRFKDMYNKDISHLVNDVLGRKKRYIADETETTLTLGARAVDNLLKKTGVKGDEIDMIVFTSQMPEFTMPTQAVMIHKHIQGKEMCNLMDINVSCIGMLRGLDVCNRYSRDKDGHMKKILLIGSDKINNHAQTDDAFVMSAFADAGCAVLFEYDDSYESKIIGTSNRTISKNANTVLFPECGMSNISKYNGDATKISWYGTDISKELSSMNEATKDVLKKHNMTVDDIDWVCPTQFTKDISNLISNELDIPMSKIIYIGDIYGYTGTSSPFIALYEGIREHKIKRGHIVLLTSIGLGATVSSVIIKY